MRSTDLFGAALVARARRLIAAPLAAAALFAAWIAPAGAAQSLDVRDGDTTIARISIRDQTRVRVDRGRILDVIGDVYDAQKSPAGRVLVLKDDEQGEVYLKPVAPASMRGPDGALPAGPLGGSIAPIKLDIKTDRGTVGLLLQPSDVVGDTLSLRINGGEQRVSVEARGKATAHIRAAKALTLAMASPAMAGEVPAQRLPGGGQEVALWKEARFVLVARYEASGLVGEAYELTNVSAERMVIDERELFRPGVVSIGVRQLQLPPGAKTPVWIVRQPGEAN